MEKQFNYVYVITNLTDNKQYIGEHSTDNIEDGYFGSGLYLEHAIKKYGKNNFKYEILEHFNSKQQAFDNQEKYIKKFNTLAPNGYNISPKGGYGKPKSFLNEETKRKISEKNKLLVGIKNSRYKELTYDEINTIIDLYLEEKTITQIQKILKLNYYKIKNVLISNNISLRKRISHKKGKTYEEIYGVNSKNIRQRLSLSRTGEKNHNYGKKFSIEHRQKISNSHSEKSAWSKGRKLSIEHKNNISIGIKNYYNEKNIQHK